MIVQPYLFFEGRCDEAVEFYRDALGAEVTMLMRYSENPDPKSCPAEIPGNKIMHASFRIGETEVMASDGMCQGPPSFKGFSLSISAPNARKAEELFAALSQGGQVQMPLTATFFSPKFGMVADRFGISWMIIVPQPM